MTRYLYRCSLCVSVFETPTRSEGWLRCRRHDCTGNATRVEGVVSYVDATSAPLSVEASTPSDVSGTGQILLPAL